MKTPIIALVMFGMLSGCGGSGSLSGSAGSSAGSTGGSAGGSFKGIFRNRDVTALETLTVAPDTRGFVPVVKDVKVKRFRGGAVLEARGLVGTVGYFDVGLAPVNDGLPDENGVITYEFRGNKSAAGRVAVTERSKEVYAGASISNIRLAKTRSIRVIAAQNQVTQRP